MTTDETLHIDQVIHQAFVDVNEKGTEAAAASAGIMANTPMERPAPPPPVIFHADHPFLYVLRDSATGLILFMGRMVDPR